MDWRILVNFIPRFWLGIQYYSLMFSWQVEFWLAKKVLLKLHGSRAATENQKSLSPMCCPFTLCTADDTHFTRWQKINNRSLWSLSKDTRIYVFPIITAGNRHKQNSWFCKEIREDNFRLWWRRVQEDTSQGMYMSKIEIFFFIAQIWQNQRMLCGAECFHD